MTGLLDDDQKRQMQNMALTNIGLSLMQPYRRDMGMGAHIGNALGAGYQVTQQYPQQVWQQMQMQMQIEDLKRKQAEAKRKQEAMGSLTPEQRRNLDLGMSADKALLPQIKNNYLNVSPGGAVFDPATGEAVFKNPAKETNYKPTVLQTPDGAVSVDRENNVTPLTMPDGSRVQGNKPTRMPSWMGKLQSDTVDVVGTAGIINGQIDKFIAAIDSGALDLGPINNQLSSARNFMGMSDENSRMYAEFQATLERLRNDSLRLNKGVQTDGDADRAWKELIPNLNDPKVVRAQLERIKELNTEAASLHRGKLDDIRTENGFDPYEWKTPQQRGSSPKDQSGASGGWDSPVERKVARTGKDASGRTVVQYEDGTIEYK